MLKIDNMLQTGAGATTHGRRPRGAVDPRTLACATLAAGALAAGALACAASEPACAARALVPAVAVTVSGASGALGAYAGALGAGGPSGGAGGSTGGPALGDSARAHLFADDLGHTVAWTQPPERIVSLSPNLTEILFAIGCDARVAGVTSYCTYPPQVAALPRVGGVADPSLEAVIGLRPDLVLATRGNPLEFMESLVRLGVPVYAVEARGGLERILTVIGQVGAVTGRSAEALHLADSLRLFLENAHERAAALPAGSRPRVYMGELEGAHWTAGPGSHIQGLIAAAGGENVGDVAPADWSPLSLEVIIARRPEVWLGAYGPTSGGDEAEVRARALEILRTHEGWRDTPLGREPRLLLVHEDRLQRPGPRVFAVAEELARFLHPDLWPAGEHEEPR